MNENAVLKCENIADKPYAAVSKLSSFKKIRELVALLQQYFYTKYLTSVQVNTEELITKIRDVLDREISIYYYDSAKRNEMLQHFENLLPEMRKLVLSDIEAAYERDPAANSRIEIIASYPGPFAVMIQRVAHKLYELNVPVFPRCMTEYAHSITGIDIHPGVNIGEKFFIDHGTGVVVGETTIIGNCVSIYQGVTLGALSTSGGRKLRHTKRHPTIEDDVTIYAGATILGGNTIIGKGAIIGGNAWITESIPKHSKINGNDSRL
ncbi:hypothetical protein C823_002190 [Eubacterium plexicaudatum ASF492]|uniref:Serine O-acetyltransferase n=1 Tax=Eubacterium plexicaudatum ASF492 TaxID=1235802 RepID=N2BIP6_9FIRM|nr:hypothetical protein C823_002190 [Eubacterium plexicaudatum ASF492]